MGLARLGRSVAFIGRVGADGLGQMVRNGLRGEGVDVRVAERRPGRADRCAGARPALLPAAEVVYLRRGSAASRLEPADVDAAGDVIAGARWLHLTGITPALSPSCRAAVQSALAVRSRRRRARLARRQPAAAPVERAGGRAGAARAGRALRPRDRGRGRGRAAVRLDRGRRCWPSASASRRSSSSVRAAPSAGATASWQRTRASRWRRGRRRRRRCVHGRLPRRAARRRRAWPRRCGVRTPAARSPSPPSATPRACPRAASWSGCWRAAATSSASLSRREGRNRRRRGGRALLGLRAQARGRRGRAARAQRARPRRLRGQHRLDLADDLDAAGGARRPRTACARRSTRAARSSSARGSTRPGCAGCGPSARPARDRATAAA